ncbi:cell division protein ZapA [Marinimicrobium alkaliphilum]|uniref:cell division protein ZapA n=1 Tax=Marinimicrobium alkaliphilum TaxID=2202654 RepID=UPI000DBA8C80|nr:cell division protein ZapA [Marinimicrobium alkaliphilum]
MGNETVSVRILDKDYQVACPPEERQALLESARLLDERMREIKRSGSVIGLERIAVMVALNLSHELMQAEQRSTEGMRERLSQLNYKLDTALTGGPKADKD